MGLFEIFRSPKKSVAVTLTEVAMMDLSAEWVAQERRRMSSADEQADLMMAYASWILWTMTNVCGRCFKPERAQAISQAIAREYSKQPWFNRAKFDRLWQTMDEMMPDLMKSRGKLSGGPPMPSVMILVVANAAGCAFPTIIDFAEQLAIVSHDSVRIQMIKKVAADPSYA